MSLINEALKRAQEELKRRNSMPYPFDATNPSKELYQKSKKPFLFFLCSGAFLGAVTILLLTLIVYPDLILQFFDSKPTPSIQTQLPTQVVSTTPVIATAEASFNPAQTDGSLNQDAAEEKAPSDLLQDSALFNTLTEMINKMVSQQAASNTHSGEDAHSTSQIAAPTIQISQNIIKPQEDKISPSSPLQESKNTLPQQDPIETFLSKLKITGIMFSGPESKVIIDNRIYSLQSKINDNPELRLLEINSHELVFEDVAGTTYKKKI